MKSKTSIAVIALLIISVSLVAGCIGGQKEYVTPPELGLKPAEAEAEEPAAAEEPAGEAPECTIHSDCDDGNECTTDSCVNGVCEHTTDPNCVVKEYKAGSISGVVTDDSDEYIVLNGQDEYIANWELTKNDERIMKFKLGQWLYGDLTIHMGNGIGTTVDLYMGKTEAYLEAGDVIKLINDDGDVVDQVTAQ